MSKHFFDLKPGDKLAIKGPILKFEYKSASLFSYLQYFGSRFRSLWPASVVRCVAETLTHCGEKRKLAA